MTWLKERVFGKTSILNRLGCFHLSGNSFLIFCFFSAQMPAIPLTIERQVAAGACEFSIIIVNYNVRDFLRQALLSVRRALAGATAEGQAAEIFVVDNASEDGSVEMVQAEFPEVRVIDNSENRGFASANNQALRLARGRYIVLLNPDTVVQEDTFLAIRDFFESPTRQNAGMVGCKILNPDGTLQLACRRSFPTPWVAFTRLSGLSRLFPRSKLFGKYNLTFLDENALAEVEAISGSFMAVRREALASVGLLDETFFLYGEDLDWCFRMRAAGWKIYYVPQTQIIHFKGESSKRSHLDSLRIFYQAMHLFARKHFRARFSAWFYWVLVAAIWIRGALSALKKTAGELVSPAFDLLLIQIALAFGIYVRFGTFEDAESFLIVDPVYTLVWMLCLVLFGCYRRQRYSPYQAFIASLTGFLINASLTYFFKQYAFSRAVVLAAGVTTIVSLSAWRLIAKVLHWLGWGPFQGALGKTLLRRRTLFVGDFASGESILPKLAGRVDGAYDLIGLISLQETDVGRQYNGLPVFASIGRLDEVIKRRRIQEVIFSMQRLPFDRVLGIIGKRRDQRISFKLASGSLDVIIGKAEIDQLNDVPLLDIEYRLQRPALRFTKRAVDFAVALFLLILCAPAFLVRWLLTDGSLAQRRVRAGQETLSLWQLQTPRGKSTRLDRLPWLLQVLSGAISLVGSELAVELERPHATQRTVLPLGLTGLVQLKNQPEMSREEKEKLHLFYATHYSPLLDLEILFRALFRL